MLFLLIYIWHEKFVQNPVAVGQYSLVRWDLNQHKNGNVSVFCSMTSRLPIKVNSSREQLLW